MWLRPQSRSRVQCFVKQVEYVLQFGVHFRAGFNLWNPKRRVVRLARIWGVVRSSCRDRQLLRQPNFQFKDEERPIAMTVGEVKAGAGSW